MKLNVKVLARATLCSAALGAAALLASCGGGGQQASSFHATRVIAFGDEFSVINNDGSKYTVNALTAGSSTALDCASNPLWIQTVAANYGLVFPQCNVTATPDPASRIWAQPGAMVADLSAQIDRQLNEGGFAPDDLVTVLVGANDVVAQFELYPAQGEDQLTANLAAAGAQLATEVNQIAAYGAKVIIVTVPNIGLTPFGGDRSAGSVDTNPALLSRLSNKFNDALLSHLLNDGHKIGLVQLDEYLQAIDTSSIQGLSSSTFTNTIAAECTVALPHCNTNTLVADSISSTYLWADNRHLTPGGQTSLGSLALQRATNNPF